MKQKQVLVHLEKIGLMNTGIYQKIKNQTSLHSEENQVSADSIPY